MSIRPFVTAAVLCNLFVLSGCMSVFPTAPEIDEAFRRQTEEAVRSAAGPWTGVASGGSIRFEFSLTQAPDGELKGSGTMREASASADVPIAVSGTYHPPSLALTFTGMVYEGREVSGTFVEAYTSFAGVSGTLRLTGENYSRTLSLLLQER